MDQRPRSAAQLPVDPVNRALVSLTNPHRSAVVIMGGRGTGKSHVLSQIQDHLTHKDNRRGQDRTPVIWVRPTHGLSDATLSNLFSHDLPAWPESPLSLATPPLLAIDDIDLMDESSLSMISLLLDRRTIQLAATVRSSHSSAVLDSLHPVRPLTLVQLQPWRRTDVQQYAMARLGGPLHELTLGRLLTFSGGNPLCVTEALDEGVAQGVLRRHFETWFWHGDIAVPPVTLARIGSDLTHIEPAVVEVLVTATMIERAPLELIESVHGTSAVLDADDAGLLHLNADHGSMTVLPDIPIQGRVAWHRMSITRRRRLAHKIVTALGPSSSIVSSRISQLAQLDLLPLDGPAAPLRNELLTSPVERASSLAQRGLLNEAANAAHRAAAADTTESASDQGPLLAAVLGFCQLMSDAIATAAASATRLREVGKQWDSSLRYDLGSLLAGMCALASGQAGVAARRLSECTVTDSAGQLLRPLAQTLLAQAYAMSGRWVDVEGALRGVDTSPLPTALDDVAQLSRAETLLITGLRHTSYEQARALADRCQSDGRYLFALLSLHLCARITPSAALTSELAHVAARTDFDLAQVYVTHARAEERRDAQVISDTAARYSELGRGWLAAETASRSISLALGHRHTPWVHRDRRIIDQLETEPSVALPMHWRDFQQAGGSLTHREREIAEKAAFGWSSPQIAAKLHLSQRTVENHLQHAYAKLGIGSRHELSKVLEARQEPGLRTHTSPGE